MRRLVVFLLPRALYARFSLHCLALVFGYFACLIIVDHCHGARDGFNQHAAGYLIISSDGIILGEDKMQQWWR